MGFRDHPRLTSSGSEEGVWPLDLRLPGSDSHLNTYCSRPSLFFSPPVNYALTPFQASKLRFECNCSNNSPVVALDTAHVNETQGRSVSRLSSQLSATLPGSPFPTVFRRQGPASNHSEQTSYALRGLAHQSSCLLVIFRMETDSDN